MYNDVLITFVIQVAALDDSSFDNVSSYKCIFVKEIQAIFWKH